MTGVQDGGAVIQGVAAGLGGWSYLSARDGFVALKAGETLGLALRSPELA
jgi:hypothetical protein